MKLVDGWNFPDHEQHLLEWMMDKNNRLQINGRSSYQGKKQQAALANCKSRRVAIDVGAHIGLWSWNLSHWFAKVEAFEPVPAHQECFLMNMSGRSNWSLHPFALGDHEDTVAMYTGPASSGDTWVKGKGEIPMRTLDSFGLNEVDFIKIDCEGYEEFVLRGAVTTIFYNRPVIVVEQKRDHATKFGLKPQGAVEYLVKEHGYKQVNEMAGDFFMVPR
jgi:FkbM family methyltransferase